MMKQVVMAEDEEKALIPGKPRTYGRRWFVLVYFSLTFILAAFMWNTWGPIALSVHAAFGWGDSALADILYVGKLGVIACIAPFSYLLDQKGLRCTQIVLLTLALVGSVMRCFIPSSSGSVWLAMLSQIVIGTSLVATLVGPSMIAYTWFPPQERALATAVTVLSSYLGMGVSYVIEPLIVSGPAFGSSGKIAFNISWDNNSIESGPSYVSNATNQLEIQTETTRLMILETSAAGVMLLVTVAALPKSPPTPPSSSATIVRMGYSHVTREIMRNAPLCVLLMYTGILVGLYSTWLSVIDVAFFHLGVNQDEAGWLGFFILLASSAVGFMFARCSDSCARRLKVILTFMFFASSAAYAWLSLLCGGVIAFSKEQLYVSSIIGCSFMNGCVPLLYELICEAAFPLPDGIVFGLSGFLSNIAGVVYLLPLSASDMTDNSWLEWVLLGCAVLGIVVTLATPQKYNRTDIDLPTHKTSVPGYTSLIPEQETILIPPSV